MKTYTKILGLFAFAAIVGITSCGHDGNTADSKQQGKQDRVTGQNKGVVLLIADADLMQVRDNPQYNTAEWLFTVKKPGRYDVWLSSLTSDTLKLAYADNVVITAGDSRLTKKPLSDEIVMDNSVRKPWYRADSHMGSIFFSKPGEYQIQVISDKVEPRSSGMPDLSVDNKQTLINSLILKPLVN